MERREIYGLYLFFINQNLKKVKEKIFEALKTKYANLGFNNEVLEGVATQLSTFITEEEKIANAVAGAESMLKSFQSFADSRVNNFQKEKEQYKTKAEQLKARLAELQNPTGKKDEPKKDEKMEGEDNELLEYLRKLDAKVDGLSKERERDNKLETAKKLLGKTQLPKKLQEKWVTRIDLDKDLEQQVKELDAEFEETFGEVRKGSSKGLPLGGRVDKEVSDKEVEEVLNEMK